MARPYHYHQVLSEVCQSDFLSQVSALCSYSDGSNFRCGQSYHTDEALGLAKQRIVGGKEASDKMFPWQAAVKETIQGTPKCGGTIITENFVITAAHCLVLFKNPCVFDL